MNTAMYCIIIFADVDHYDIYWCETTSSMRRLIERFRHEVEEIYVLKCDSKYSGYVQAEHITDGRVQPEDLRPEELNDEAKRAEEEWLIEQVEKAKLVE
jgi:hypothetical protein